MQRIISPPKDQLSQLRQSLTEGEQIVFHFFDKYLPEKWEIYLQPHLNGLRPDFVLLNSEVGIAVFEVKDWNFEAMDYWTEMRSGWSPELTGRKDGKAFSQQSRNPIEQVYRYKQEIEELYCPRLKMGAGKVVITAGVIFPFADDERVKELFRPSRDFRAMTDRSHYYPISGREGLESDELSAVFPEALRPSSWYMKNEVAADLRNWLVEPDIAGKQRRPLELDKDQKLLVTSRTESGYRRIKGAAGSGKSLILAARAAQLISEGKKVLVVTYNITLLHYLMDLAVRWPHRGASTRKRITWMNFHSWCKRVCLETDRGDVYDNLWHQSSGEDTGEDRQESREQILGYQLPQLVNTILESERRQLTDTYDAILVDEGQDFRPAWWDALRKALNDGGEMLLVADASQDNYGAAKSWPVGAWTDNPMPGAGFSGHWVKLEKSYRLPPSLKSYVIKFTEQYLPYNLRELPDNPQEKFDYYPCNLRWVQTSRELILDICLDEILNLVEAAEPEILSIADITFLVDNLESGRVIVEDLEKCGINSVHTFSSNSKKRRLQKLGFYMGDARVKGTTIHSFKGWEARALVICIERAMGSNSMSLIYSGITRLKRHEKRSFLTVVCSASILEEYGRSWPNYSRA